ncbi:MAG: squalene synthase HpnD [Candidatus Rokubacteria bacterium GWC2_70_24]|nr:MAG: squalene synthase HpnD [Candidatus Rokubacteria bacterium GWA2_70_23]OGK91360.1 MAG: squalene synthase HpnD [Candidatus Rokubacteria bacterium GWC2_70_24]OGK92475.1 MAG: squalene synthase HpnD [Candidatus Rokubacteria bacterium GWF2_70_14]
MNAERFVSRLTRKSRSNFFYAFLLLPRAQREAIFAVYAFCRIVDDTVDVGQDRPAQRQELRRWRGEIGRVFEGRPEHPAAQRLQQAIRAFPIPRSALEDIIDGVEMDLDHPTYETFEALYPYCYRVASAVGLCAIAIFGHADPRAREYAVNLGIALQLTNILRDVQQDARMGRVYLPQEDLSRFGVTADELRDGRYTPGFVELMTWEAARARDFYGRAWQAFPETDRRTLFAAEIMGRTYFALLRALEASRFRVFDRQVTVPAARRLVIALSCWANARLRGRSATKRPPVETTPR